MPSNTDKTNINFGFFANRTPSSESIDSGLIKNPIFDDADDELLNNDDNGGYDKLLPDDDYMPVCDIAQKEPEAYSELVSSEFLKSGAIPKLAERIYEKPAVAAWRLTAKQEPIEDEVFGFSTQDDDYPSLRK